MREIKKEFRWFSITEYEKEADYLSQKHKEGWKFQKVTFPGIYTFEKCEPENVIYQLDYNTDGLKDKDTYIRMFEDCGWEYLMNFYGYSYFRKPQEEAKQKENIFCDDDSRLDMMNRIFYGRVVPLILIFICLLYNAWATVSRGEHIVFTIIFAVLTVLYLILFADFAVKYFSFRRKIKK